MGLDAKEIVFYLRKGLVFSAKTWYKSVFDHPFVWVMAIFLVFLYKFVPALFLFLISSSPVIVCTAVLLGTLLSFGEPRIPQVEEIEEEEEKMTHEISSLKVEGVSDDLVTEKEGKFGAETIVGERREMFESRIEEQGVEESKSGNREVDFSLTCVEERGREMGFQGDEQKDEIKVAGDVETREKNGELGTVFEIDFHDQMPIEMKQFLDQKLIVEGSSKMGKSIEDVEREGKSVRFNIASREETSGEETIEGHRREVKIKSDYADPPENEICSTNLEKSFDSAMDPSWKQFERGDYSDSGSDGAESSSPDASIADILPMLDELHPLLDSEAPQLAHISPGESDGSSEDEKSLQSHGSEEEDVAKSDDEGVIQEEGVNGDENETVVKWTEDDEKNLMDLGTSELERNQRLENLIAKRQARKSQSQRAQEEKNLIDLDSEEPAQVQIPPVSPIKHNPFDLPYNAEVIVGLPNLGPPAIDLGPAVISSVPLKRNPFDLPYDPAAGQSSNSSLGHQGFVLHLDKHESSMLGEQFLGEIKQEKSYMKVHSFYEPDTRTSIIDRPDFLRQMSLVETSFTGFRQGLGDDGPIVSARENVSVSFTVPLGDQRGAAEQEFRQEGGFDPLIDHGVKSVEGDVVLQDRRSESSEEVGSADVEQEQSDIEVDDVHEIESVSSDVTEETHDESGHLKAEEEEISHKIESREKFARLQMVEEKFEDTSSGSSSSSEGKEGIFEVNTSEALESLEQPWGDASVRSGGSGRVREPVYDSSPSALEKSHLDMSRIVETEFFVQKEIFSSVSPDARSDVSEMGSPLMMIDQHGLPEDGESSFISRSEGSNRTREKSEFLPVLDSVKEIESVEEPPSSAEQSWVLPLGLSTVEENELRSRAVLEIQEQDVIQAGLSRIQPSFDEPVERIESFSFERAMPKPLDDAGSSRQSEEVQIVDPIAVGDYLIDAEEKLDVDGTSSDDSSSTVSEASHALIEKFVAWQSTDADHGETQEQVHLQSISAEEIDIGSHPDELNRELDSNESSNQGMPTVLIEPHVKEDISEETQIARSGDDAEEDSVEEELKEISEELLSELDAVGDFHIEGSISDPNRPEKQSESDPNSNGQIYGDAKMDPAISSGLAEPELQVIETGSVERTGSGSKHFCEVGSENLGVIQSDEPKPTESKVDSSSNSELQVLEARSLEDINMALKQFELQCSEDQPKQVESEASVDLNSSGPMLMESNSDIQVLEARSIEDIDRVLRRFSEGGDEKHIEFRFSEEDRSKLIESEVVGDEESIVLDPNDSKAGSKESEIGSGGNRSELQVPEARSLEHLDLALKQSREGDVEQPIVHNLAEKEAGSAEPEATERHVLQSCEGDVEQQIVHHLVKEAGSTEAEATERHVEPVEDLDLGSKQSCYVEQQIVHNKLEKEAGSTETETAERHLGPVLEVRSVEEIGSGLGEPVDREIQQTHAVDTENSKVELEKTSNPSQGKLRVKKKNKKAEVSGESSSSSSDSD